jgi:spore germination protein YaaH
MAVLLVAALWQPSSTMALEPEQEARLRRASREAVTTVAEVDASQLGYQAKGLNREVLGFLNHFHLDYALQHLDYDAVSTIAFFSIQADRNGHLMRRTSSGAKTARWAAWTGSKMSTIIQRAHNNLSKVVFSVERFAWSSAGRVDTTALLSSSVARQTLANEIANAVVSRGVDGVNLDFEPIPTGQRANYVSFVRAVRRALDAKAPGYQLTFAATGFIGNYDIAALTAPGAADAVYIMGYQYRGSWSSRAGSTAPLAGPIYDVGETVDAYLELTTPGKIILGVPYYGYAWSTAGWQIHSLTTGSYVRSILYAESVGLAAEHGLRYDTIEKSAWTVWRYQPCSTCTSQWRQLYFDSVRSLGAKYELVNRKGLRGAGVWALGFEGSRPELYSLLKRKFGQ